MDVVTDEEDEGFSGKTGASKDVTTPNTLEGRLISPIVVVGECVTTAGLSGCVSLFDVAC